MKYQVFAGLPSFAHNTEFPGQNFLPKVLKAIHTSPGVQKLLCYMTYYLHIYEYHNSWASQAEYQLEVTISDIQNQEFYLQTEHNQRCCSHFGLSKHSSLASYWPQHQSPNGNKIIKYYLDTEWRNSEWQLQLHSGCMQQNRTVTRLPAVDQSLITNFNSTVQELGILTAPVVCGWQWLQSNVFCIGTSLDRQAQCNSSGSVACSLLNIQYVNADFWCPNGPITKGSIILTCTWWKKDSHLLKHHVYTNGCLRKWIHI